ncbi:hypothetical protein ACYQR9_15310 [Methylobacterium sp. CM6241]
MSDDPLWQKILDETQPGDPPFTVEEAVERWGYSQPHTRSLLKHMTTEKPPVMRQDTSVSPYTFWRV